MARSDDAGTVPGRGDRILIAEPRFFSPRAVKILRQAGEVVLEPLAPGELTRALAEYDAVWVRLGHALRRQSLPAALRCRLVATATTGLDHLDLDVCREHGIEVISLKGETEFLREIRATAELTVALALALLRRIPAAAASVLKGEWDRDRFRGRELYGRTAGIVGMGRLGTLVAGYLRAFGMEVLGHDVRADFPDEAAQRVSLPELLARADVVSLHVSYQPGDPPVLGEAEFAAMKRGAVLVNTSRGGVVDSEALLLALKSRRLAGVALDVLDGEPEVRYHPLVHYAREHEEVLIVPHIGGHTVESFEKTETFLAHKVVAALSGREARA